jgi:hypothetical protein
MKRLARTRSQRVPLLLLVLSLLLLPLLQAGAWAAPEPASNESEDRDDSAVRDDLIQTGEGPHDPTGEGDPDDFDCMPEVVVNLLLMKYFLFVF